MAKEVLGGASSHRSLRELFHLPHMHRRGPSKEHERSNTLRVDIKEPRYEGLLLNTGAVLEARRMVDEGWAAQIPTDATRKSLLALIRDGSVGAFRPREVQIPEDPEHVIFFPNTPYVSDALIADRLRGEQGLMRTTISLSPMQGKGETVSVINYDDVLNGLRQIPACPAALDGKNGNDVVSQFLHGASFGGGTRDFSFVLEGEGFGLRMYALSNPTESGIQIDISPLYEPGSVQLPVFGERKQAMLALTHGIAVAFDH